MSKGNAFAKKSAVNETEAKSPNRNQYVESTVTDYKGVPSQNYSKEEEKIINKVFDQSNTSSPTVPQPQQKTISDVSHIDSDSKYTKKEGIVIQTIFDDSKKKEDIHDPYSPNYKPNMSKNTNTVTKKKSGEGYWTKKDSISNQSKSSQSSSSRRTAGGTKKSIKDPNMNTITEEKYKKGANSAQDVNKPTNDTNKAAGDRRSSLYSPTISSRKK